MNFKKFGGFLFVFIFVAVLSCTDEEEVDIQDHHSEEKECNNGLLSGKTFSVLGNSISTYLGCIPEGFRNFYSSKHFSLNDTWWMRFATLTGATLLSNASWSGSTVAYTGKDNSNSYFYSDARIDSLGGKAIPDFIIVIGGTNDWGLRQCDFGCYPSEDTLTFIGAYTTMLKKIRHKYENSIIVCSSILPRSQGVDETNQKGWTISMANNYIERIAEDNNCLFVNMDNCGIDKPSKKYMIDSVHPNASGMRLIAEAFYIFFQKINIIEPHL